MTIQMDTRARVTVDSSGAIGPLKTTQTATRDLAQEMRQAATAAEQSGDRIAAAARQAASAQISASQAARQSRAAYQQLGFQISDVAAQAAVGTNPMIIFAQQGGQIAQALAGAGGVLGRVAGFLAGPWGAALLGAGAILGVLASNAGDAGDAAEDMADRYGDAAADVQLASDSMDRAISSLNGLLNDAGNWFADFAIKVGGELAEATNEVADFIERTNGLIPRVLGGGPALLASGLEAQRAAARQGIAGRQAERALASTGGNQLFGFDPYRSGEFKPFDSKSLETFSKGAERAREEGEREARRFADTASREAKRAADAATREAQRFATEQAKLVEGLAALARKTSAELDQFARGDGSLVGLIERAEAADAARKAADNRSRDATGLSAAVASAEGNIDLRKQVAKLQADAFNRTVLGYAQTIGDAIGNAAGRSVTQVVEAVLAGQLGNIRGPAGNAIRGLQPLARELGRDQSIREGLRPLTNQLKQVFGDQPFNKHLGKAFQSAGFGAAIAGIVGKGSREENIGGAIGAMGGQALGTAIGGPLGGAIGKIAGSIIGTTIGGLFVRVKSGSVAISGSNGQIITGAATGTGADQRRNAEAMGSGISGALQSIVDQLGGTVGNFAVSIGQRGGKFRVDPTGAGRTRKRQAGVLAFGEDADAAYAAALEDAIRDGAIGGVSSRVQSALQRYASDVDKAVAEALKVQGLENFLSDRANPFGRAFREFERQAADRLKVARKFGFDVVEIEKVNAEERAKLLKEQLADTTSSARALLDDLRFGSRAEGSVRDRLSALGAERSRLEGLVAGGDTGQIDAVAQIIQQQLGLSREAFGSTGQFAADRGAAIGSLETLIRQTEDRISAASAAAQNPTVDKLTELNTSADETVTELQRQTALLQQLAAGGGAATFSIGAFARVPV